MIKLAKVLGVAFCAAAICSVAWGQVIFQQDFSTSTIASDYVSTTPNSGQWNAISTSGVGVTVSITGGALQFTRGLANAGSFSRTTDFSPTPSGMKYKFDLTVSGNITATTSAAVFQVGSAFGTANSAQVNADTYARFGINISATTGNFSIRDITNLTSSSEFSGTQIITWALNNSGGTFTYTAPDASTESLADDKADLWVGTTRVLDDVNVQTTTQVLTDLKFAFTEGTATITLDNFEIGDETTLPIQLTSFTAAANRLAAELHWSTATETNNYGFDVERRAVADGLHQQDGAHLAWAKVGFVAGAGTSTTPRDYSYVDANLTAGRYAYRLKQIDNDGSFEYYSGAEVEVGLAAKEFRLESNYPNPFNPSTTIQFTLAQDGKATLRVYNMLGQEVATLFDGEAQAGRIQQVNFDGSRLPSGLYFAKLEAGKEQTMRKMVLLK